MHSELTAHNWQANTANAVWQAGVKLATLSTENTAWWQYTADCVRVLLQGAFAALRVCVCVCVCVCVRWTVKYDFKVFSHVLVCRYLLSQDWTQENMCVYVCVCVWEREQERKSECDPGADGSPELIYPHRCGGRPVGNASNCCRGVERGALL